MAQALVDALDVRTDFPFLRRRRNGTPLVYFDNAATTQKPRCVLQAIESHYENAAANVHRAGNFLAHEVTEAFESSRRMAARFLGAEPREIIFVSNATHGLNLACAGISRGRRLRVLTSTLEHHSNWLPWFSQADVRCVPWSRSGQLDLAALDKELEARPDLLAITYASNFLGAIQPVRDIVAMAHRRNVPVLVDASQAIAHMAINVRDLDCDYLVFSGHKIYGPAGTGVLFVRHSHLDHLAPMFFGGGMIKEVRQHSFALNEAPFRFEAGTPNIEGIIGLGAAIRYIDDLGYERIAAHESCLVRCAKQRLAEMPNLELYGPAFNESSTPLVSFRVKGLDSSTVEKVLAERGNVIVRSGFHCAQPAHEALGVGPTVRASFGLYNNTEEIDAMLRILGQMTEHL